MNWHVADSRVDRRLSLVPTMQGRQGQKWSHFIWWTSTCSIKWYKAIVRTTLRRCSHMWEGVGCSLMEYEGDECLWKMTIRVRATAQSVVCVPVVWNLESKGLIKWTWVNLCFPHRIVDPLQPRDSEADDWDVWPRQKWDNKLPRVWSTLEVCHRLADNIQDLWQRQFWSDRQEWTKDR